MSKSGKQEYRETVVLVSERQIDLSDLKDLAEYLRGRDIDLRCIELNSYCIRECQNLIKKHGPSHVLSIVELREEFLPKASTTKGFALLVQTLRGKLADLDPCKSLTLVDSYMFVPSIRDRQGYLQVFNDIFGQVASSVSTVRMITSPDHFSESLYHDVAQLLQSLNPSLAVSYSLTADFHDRFWIADEERGLFIGTSLNGIGKRYALVDNMRDEDTKAVVDELRRLNLI